jgi:hypothetical protein
MYKIIFDTVKIFEDGSTGNISQGIGCAYSDLALDEIEHKLKEALAERNLLPTIDKIEKRIGIILT